MMHLRRTQYGMTLVELLVMMVIVAISVGMILPQISWIRQDPPLREEMREFASLLELTRDEAALQGRNFGLRFYPDHFVLYELDPDNGAWFLVQEDELLTGAEFRQDTLPTLFVEDREIILEPPEDDDNDNQPVADAFGQLVEYAQDVPQIAILSSGEVTPFTLELNLINGAESLQLNADVFGDLDIVDLKARR
ncbi:MAG: GspH/FimT family pseudopilin [Pseudomonadota bacterium]